MTSNLFVQRSAVSFFCFKKSDRVFDFKSMWWCWTVVDQGVAFETKLNSKLVPYKRSQMLKWKICEVQLWYNVNLLYKHNQTKYRRLSLYAISSSAFLFQYHWVSISYPRSRQKLPRRPTEFREQFQCIAPVILTPGLQKRLYRSGNPCTSLVSRVYDTIGDSRQSDPPRI